MDIVSKALLFTLYHFIWYLENESTTSVTMTLSPLPTITIMTATCLEDYLGSDHVPVSQIVPYKHHLAWSSQKDMRENYIIIFYSREDWGRKRWIFLVTQRESELDRVLILNPVLLACAVFPWTGRPGVLRFMGLQSQTRLSDWTDLIWMIWRLSTPYLLYSHWKVFLSQFLSLKSSKVTGSGSSIPGSVPTILSRMGPDFSKGPEYMHIRAHVCKAPTPYSDFCFSFPKQKNTHLLCMHFNKQRTIFQETDVLHKKPHATIFFYLFPVVWGQENWKPFPCNLQ